MRFFGIRLVRKILLWAIILVGVFVLFFSRPYNRERFGAQLPKPILTAEEHIGTATDALGTLPQVLGTNTNQAAEGAQQAVEQVQNVLETEVQGTTEAPLHERAFEYGKYQYCKQVVEEFERNQPQE